MSIVVGVVLGCTALVSIVVARISFRVALAEGANRPVAWGAAGSSMIGTVTVVCTEAALLDLGDLRGEPPSGARVAAAIVAVVVAAFVAFLAYDVTGPAPATAGGSPYAGLSQPKRWASAAASVTGTYVVIALVLPLVT